MFFMYVLGNKLIQSCTVCWNGLGVTGVYYFSLLRNSTKMAEQLPNQGKNVHRTLLRSFVIVPKYDAVELANLDEAILNQMDQIQKEVR